MSERTNYFVKHLGFSCIVAFIIFILLFVFWYPAPLAKATGVTHIVIILMTIDVVVGPLFSLLVYKVGKKTLKFDLTIIIILQLSALFYGISTIEKGRPAWLAYNVDRFELIRKNEIVEQNIKQAKPQFQQPSRLKPQFVATEFSEDANQRSEDMFAEVFNGISIAQRPERYVELTQAKTQIQQRALPLKELEQYNSKTEVEKTLAKYPKADAWLPLKANAVDMVVLIDKEKAEVIKIVDLRPWN